MRRWFTIFLLVFLPLQATWTAASSYCQHESGPSAQHFGHHDHNHQIKVGNLDHSASKPIKSPLVVDGDCSFCHPCCAAVLLEVVVVPSPHMRFNLEAPYSGRMTSALSTTPDRPNWQHLV